MNKANIYNRFFSHIYVEHSVLNHPETIKICNHFTSSMIIEINDYREVFNRHQQDWTIQKKSQKLILASRKDNFLYQGDTAVTPSFGHINYFYNALVLNCLYDCEYCYLQGMFTSAHAVVFVNIEDYFLETQRQLARLGSMYLCISYDSDLLAFEDFLGYVRQWIEFASKNSSLTLEIRTKSANFKSISALPPLNNVILAWTLSPETIIKKYEHKTPNIKARIKSLANAVNAGWPVRICLDPIIVNSNWEESYKLLIAEIAAEVELSKLNSIYLGTFRLNHGHFASIKNKRIESDLFINQKSYEKQNGLISYNAEIQEQVKRTITEFLIEAGSCVDRVSWI